MGRKPATQFTAEEKLQIVLAGMKGGASVTELCRRHGISQPTYYAWRDKVLSGATQALSGPGASTEVQGLRERVAELERTLGRKTLELEIAGKALGRSA